MVYWFVAPAALATAGTIATWIGRLLGLYFVGIFVRDVGAGVSTPVEVSKDDTIQAIIDDPTLTAEQKDALIKAYLDSIGEEDWAHTLMIVAVILALAYVAASYMKGK